MDSTRVCSTSCPVATVVSMTGYTARTAVMVTVLALAAKPSSTWRGSQGLRASFSAKQKEYRPGLASVALSISPGMSPETFRITSRHDGQSIAPAPLLVIILDGGKRVRHLYAARPETRSSHGSHPSAHGEGLIAPSPLGRGRG